MTRLTRLLPLLAALTAQACMSSTLVLHVMADGRGQAVIASEIFESGLKAFDAMFADSPKELPTLEDLLPPPSDGALERAFGSEVRLVSTKLDKRADGGVRTTVADFDDITRLRLTFPPIFALPSGGHASIAGIDGSSVITFAVKPHENGDRLLLVRMPDEQLDTQGDEPITSFENDSARELLFKRAIRGSALRLFVELDQPLLRTNAPDRTGNRATILDLDLDKMINAMDETKARRMMTRASMQEMLWQVDDLPGAIVPVEHEIFLEYESPQQQPPPAAPAPAAQAPPDTEIYLAPMKTVNGAIEIGPAVDITNNPGYDNQPFFTPDGRGLLFTSVRGPGVTQTDIYRYDIAAKRISQVTATPESEYSPTISPAGNLSVIRVELDADKTQRLWQFTADGRDPRPVLETIKPVGYHAWADAGSLALFVLGQPATLQLADTRSGTAVTLATDIGRSLQRIPVAGGAAAGTVAISFVQRERTGDGVSLVIKELNPSTRAISVLTPAVPGSTEADCAWTPDGTLLMVKGATLYGWRRGQSGWKEVVSLERLGLSGVTRLAVSPQGDYLALVGRPPVPSEQ
jgi:WD40-like Beta Propeller Repeat